MQTVSSYFPAPQIVSEEIYCKFIDSLLHNLEPIENTDPNVLYKKKRVYQLQEQDYAQGNVFLNSVATICLPMPGSYV